MSIVILSGFPSATFRRTCSRRSSGCGRRSPACSACSSGSCTGPSTEAASSTDPSRRAGRARAPRTRSRGCTGSRPAALQLDRDRPGRVVGGDALNVALLRLRELVGARRCSRRSRRPASRPCKSRSIVAGKSLALTGVPFEYLMPSRSVNVYVNPSAETFGRSFARYGTSVAPSGPFTCL